MPTARVQEADCSRFVPRLALAFPLRAFLGLYSSCSFLFISIYYLLSSSSCRIFIYFDSSYLFSFFSFLRFWALVRHVYARSSACAGRSGCFSYSTRRAFLLNIRNKIWKHCGDLQIVCQISGQVFEISEPELND